MELMKEVESLKSSMAKLTRGEHKHKEMLFHHARDFGKRGLGSYPWPTKAKPNPRRSRQASSKKWVPIVNIAKSPVTTLGSASCLLFLSLLCLRTLLYSKIIIFT
jgi:hypothetical protein